MGSRSRIAAYAAVILIAIAAPFLGSRGWSLFVGDLGAAVRFEVRLAEDKTAPGLREVKVLDSDRSIYLHDEVVISNSDIAAARLVQGSPTQYSVGIEFNASGAEKMRVATAGHVGRPVAILLDGQVVMAPVVRASLGASAVITGNFTRTQAERIVKGIGIH
jgi:preprotein translocase subunit SecD